MKRLDYLAIPLGSKESNRQRKARALKELKNTSVGKILILRGKDSEEDILYLGQLLKKGDSVGFNTFPLHYKEYKTLIKKAKRDGKFPRGVKIENVSTDQPPKEFIYGILGLLEEKLKTRKLDYRKNRDEKIWQNFKNFIKRLINYLP